MGHIEDENCGSIVSGSYRHERFGIRNADQFELLR